MLYALFRDGRQISKAHSTRIGAVMEAFERGAVLSWSPDFGSDQPAADMELASDCEIKELPE